MNKVKEIKNALGYKTYSELADRMKLKTDTLKQWASTGKHPEWFTEFADTLVKNQQLEQASDKIQSLLIYWSGYR